MVFSRFAASCREIIFDRLPGFEFASAFSDGVAIPTEFTLGQALPAIAEGFDNPGHVQASVSAFELLGGLNVEPLESIVEFHRRSVTVSRRRLLRRLNNLFSGTA